MITIWVIYLLAAVAASGIFVAAGWHGRQANGFTSRQANGLTTAGVMPDIPYDALWAEDDVVLDTPANGGDVAAAIRLALKRLAPVMARQLVKVEIAAPTGLTARMEGTALTALLEELLAAAVQGAPGSRLLVTATMHGDRIHVGITDDMPGADAVQRSRTVRNLIEQVAMRGGALEVDVRPAEGTTMTLRIAAERPIARDHALIEEMPAAPLMPSIGL